MIHRSCIVTAIVNWILSFDICLIVTIVNYRDDWLGYNGTLPVQDGAFWQTGRILPRADGAAQRQPRRPHTYDVIGRLCSLDNVIGQLHTHVIIMYTWSILPLLDLIGWTCWHGGKSWSDWSTITVNVIGQTVYHALIGGPLYQMWWISSLWCELLCLISCWD